MTRMKRGDIVWFFNAGHELKYGEILRMVNRIYVIKDPKGRLHRRRVSQLAIKEERCKKSKEQKNLIQKKPVY